ncbi:MAG TPA: hypothetical protein VGR20_07085 [Acidimicrobiia bacterium]|nr:hypothetical protein [Acidimicrobiia bacterium]
MSEKRQKNHSLVLALALLIGACGNDGEGTDAVNATKPTGTTGSSNGAALPGERVETFPYQGAPLAVVGVAADDTLNVRSGPGPQFDVVFELGPMAMNATATGHNRSVGEAGVWSEIAVDARTGWAKTAFLLQPGEVRDITAALFPTPADRPTAKTMLELGQTVARLRARGDREPDIVVVEHPTVGDLGEITVDVIGLGDDSVGGERLKVFAEPGPGRERFTVRTVEATTFCSRGVTKERLCV